MSKITIRLIKPMMMAASVSIFSLSSINVANAYPNLCPGGTPSNPPANCSGCHSGTTPARNNYKGNCATFNTGGGGGNGGGGNGGGGNGGGGNGGGGNGGGNGHGGGSHGGGWGNSNGRGRPGGMRNRFRR